MSLRDLLSERELDEVERYLEYLRDLNSRMPIVVEGMRDERALRMLGFRGEIIRINLGLSLVDLVDSISSRYGEIILLMDWDPQGDELEKRLLDLFESAGVNCHPEVRENLMRLLPHISTVEEIIL